MQPSNARPLHHYYDLINRLNPRGRYQVVLMTIMVIYWLLSGLNETVFQLTTARKIMPELFFSQVTVQIIVIMLSMILSRRVARTTINRILIGLLVAGCIVFSIGVFIVNSTTMTVGVFLIVIFSYPMSLNLIMIALEYVQLKCYPIVWGLGLLGYTLGRFLAVILNAQNLNDKEWALKVALPCCVFYILSVFLVEQSPRFWIDQNITEAEKLLYKIAKLNKLKYQPLEQLLQRQFFWHKVSLNKYNLRSLLSYKSISFNTYVLCIQALLLGIICRCPDFIQHLREGSSFQVDDEVETLWVSTFQIIALVPSYLGSVILRRKRVAIAGSSVLLLLTIFLAILELGKFYMGNAIIYTMCIFGLNSFFSMCLFYYLFLTAIEFYPQTIRTLACGTIFCVYQLGRLLFSIHIQQIQKFYQRSEGMMQLVLCCSILLLLHSFLLYETYGQQGRYDLPQIEQKQGDDYMPL